MIAFAEDPQVTASMQQWRGRSILPTRLGSEELRGLGSEIHLRSIFSARTTNAMYLQEVQRVVDDMLAGKFELAEGRYRLMRKLKDLGYDPAVGFPEEVGLMEPAERDSLQDLSSEMRIDLLLKTNIAIARNYGRLQAGNTTFALSRWPAWELIRVAPRETPRGTPESHTAGWPRRWADAGESIFWEGALPATSANGGRMVGLKGSPIWESLADGVGGYTDTLGHPFPPFAFNSGMDWRAVKREECEALGLLAGKQEARKPGAAAAGFAPTEKEKGKILPKLTPELAAALKARWA